MMNFYAHSNVKQDLLTKFCYKNIFELPKIHKISLTFTLSSSSLKTLLPCLSALTLVTEQKACHAPIKKSKVYLKLKTGVPVKCYVDLRGKQSDSFLMTFLLLVANQLKDFHGFSVSKQSVFFRINNLFAFKVIEKEYEHFPDLPSLSGNIFFRTSSPLELAVFLSSLTIPIKKNS